MMFHHFLMVTEGLPSGKFTTLKSWAILSGFIFLQVLSWDPPVELLRVDVYVAYFATGDLGQWLGRFKAGDFKGNFMGDLHGLMGGIHAILWWFYGDLMDIINLMLIYRDLIAQSRSG